MTNSEQVLREKAINIFADIFTAGGEAHEVGGQSFDQLQQSGYIDRKLSDLTALIEEHYYPKEFVEWTMMQGIMGIYDRKGYLYSSALLNLKGFKGDNTIKNLFNYWKENVRC